MCQQLSAESECGLVSRSFQVDVCNVQTDYVASLKEIMQKMIANEKFEALRLLICFSCSLARIRYIIFDFRFMNFRSEM